MGVIITFPAHADVFGTAQAEYKTSDYIPQWATLLDQYQLENHADQTKKSKVWKHFIRSLKHDTPLRQILKVNLWFNSFPYKQDNWIYNTQDHWASPAQFLENGGDCEDFALIKYFTLRQLGFDAQNMQIAIVYDIYSGTDHAFLTITYEGEEYVLDNRDNITVAAPYKERYRPYYTFNENQLKLYQKPVIAQTLRKDMDDTVLPGNR